MIDFQYLSIPLKCTQLLYVSKPEDGQQALLSTFNLIDGAWVDAGFAQNVNIGSNGFAPPRRKREGDLKTPTGLFPIGIAFGYGDFCLTGLDYRKIEADSYWIDAIESEFYNQWVNEIPTCSSEKMLREDGLYRYGIVIEYNTNPVFEGRGSAIFIHIQSHTNSTTHGCLSLPEEYLISMLSWLDQKSVPHILMGV